MFFLLIRILLEVLRGDLEVGEGWGEVLLVLARSRYSINRFWLKFRFKVKL